MQKKKDKGKSVSLEPVFTSKMKEAVLVNKLTIMLPSTRLIVPPFQTDDESSEESLEEQGQSTIQGKANSTQTAPPSLKIIIPASSSRKRKTVISSSSEDVGFRDIHPYAVNFPDTSKGTTAFKQNFAAEKICENRQQRCCW